MWESRVQVCSPENVESADGEVGDKERGNRCHADVTRSVRKRGKVSLSSGKC